MDRKRIHISGRDAPLLLEQGFWDALVEIARDHNSTPSALIAMATNESRAESISSDVRVYILEFFRRKSVAYLH